MIRKQTCCESLNINCDQGRACPHRQPKIKDEIVMFEKPFQWLTDIFYSAVFIGISVTLGVLLAYYFVLFVG